MTQQWVLNPQAQEYSVVIPSNKTDLHGCADWVYRVIRVVKQTKMMQFIPVAAIVEPVHLVHENAASDRINSIWLVYNRVDLDIYWTVC